MDGGTLCDIGVLGDVDAQAARGNEHVSAGMDGGSETAGGVFGKVTSEYLDSGACIARESTARSCMIVHQNTSVDDQARARADQRGTAEVGGITAADIEVTQGEILSGWQLGMEHAICDGLDDPRPWQTIQDI